VIGYVGQTHIGGPIGGGVTLLGDKERRFNQVAPESAQQKVRYLRAFGGAICTLLERKLRESSFRA
jgi:hypothetical protein